MSFDSKILTNGTTHTDYRSGPCRDREAPPVEIGVGSSVGSYRLLKLIGMGGMGTVFEAVHTMLPRHVALKVLNMTLRDTPGMISRMVQEASILDDVRHPGIVRIFDCGLLPDRRPWIAMELVVGEGLGARLAREGTLTPRAVCEVVATLADVLATVHARGIIHRDLKPDNVLFADAASGCPLRIIDWGVAHLRAASRLTLDGLTCGTPVYMSPEQATGLGIAAPCDIYSLGVLAYEALAGAPPFEGRSLAEVVSQHITKDASPLAPQFPPAARGLCALIHRMLEKCPGLRPSAAAVRDSALLLAAELGALDLARGDGTAAIALQPTSRPLRWTPEMPFATTTYNKAKLRHQGTCWGVSGIIERGR